jgi:hypothetical protein
MLKQILRILCKMSEINFAYKIWKKDVWEVFMDSKFFTNYLTDIEKWKKLIQGILSNEKEKLNEILGNLLIC